MGAFIIFNTFSITVAQRAREFGLLRTLGSTRGQILRSVILEALIIGVVSSVIGLLLGLLLAQGLNAIFKSFGVDLPNAGLIVQTRTVVVALLVGTIVTLLAGSVPAIRATQVPPIAALREGAQLPRGRFGRFLPFIAAGADGAGSRGAGLGHLWLDLDHRATPQLDRPGRRPPVPGYRHDQSADRGTAGRHPGMADRTPHRHHGTAGA